MQYGHFDNARREYVIDRVDVPQSMTNYLGTQRMGAVVSHNAGGYCWLDSPQFHRITRFRPNGVPMDFPGHYVYIRDDETGKYWSVSWQPVGSALPAFVNTYTADGNAVIEVAKSLRGYTWEQVDAINGIDGFQFELQPVGDVPMAAFVKAESYDANAVYYTKNAKSGKTQITYNGFLQTKTVAKRLDAMNTYDYVMSNYEYALLRGTSNLNSFYKQFGVYDDLTLYKDIDAIDWQDDMFGANVLSQSHNLSLTGGTDKTKFSLSGTYDYNGGLMPDNDFSRYAFMFKLNHDINKKLKFSLKANVSDQLANGQGTQGGTYKIRTSQAMTSVATKGMSEFITPDFASMSDEELQEFYDKLRIK